MKQWTQKKIQNQVVKNQNRRLCRKNGLTKQMAALSGREKTSGKPGVFERHDENKETKSRG